MNIDQITQPIAIQMIESLKHGIPPEKGIQAYSVGHDKLIQGINRRCYFKNLENIGLIRFISGSWGSGKTHLFGLLGDIAFENNCLVSNVKLSNDDACLNKFERVFGAIVRNINTPKNHDKDSNFSSFGMFLRESFGYLSKGHHTNYDTFSHEDHAKARQTLMANESIDIDFRKIVQRYWSTFLGESSDPASQDQIRGELLQWFSGEGTLSSYRKYGINKIVSRANCKLIFQSLAKFVHLSGYQGLVILFDEAEQSYSVMRQSSLKDAHVNLMSLINGIDDLKGLFLLYATTPDFYTDPKHGIIIFPALATKVGKPEEYPPRVSDPVWNLDRVNIELEDYKLAANRIAKIFTIAYPEIQETLPSEKNIKDFVDGLFSQYSEMSGVRFWRVLVTALTKYLDSILDGEIDINNVDTEIVSENMFIEVMKSLQEI